MSTVYCDKEHNEYTENCDDTAEDDHGDHDGSDDGSNDGGRKWNMLGRAYGKGQCYDDDDATMPAIMKCRWQLWAVAAQSVGN